jgi:dihydrofolate reductase
MRLSIMVAMDEQGVIGAGGALPWHLSADLQQVKKITMGKPVIMGRKTHESIGRPLPGRENIVLSRDPRFRAPGCTVFNDLEQALEYCRAADEVFIMGGVELFRLTLARAARIYLTEVHARVQGDTCFPEFNRSEWREIGREQHAADENNEYPYSFVRLERF